MKIRAKFIGTDNRKKFQYKFGRTYTLNFDIVSRSFGSIHSNIEISKFNEWERLSERSYSSLRKFLTQWEVI